MILQKDLISVIIPIYNTDKYLERCIESVRNQSYKKLLIILVDDGSTDKSGKIADKVAECDVRITVIHKKNGGLSDARNYGIKRALDSNSKYITFIDSDDYVTRDYIEYLYNLVKNNNAEISICGMKKTSLQDDISGKKFCFEECYSKETALAEMLYSKKFSTSAWGKLYPTYYFDNVRFPVGKYAEDLFTTYKLFNMAHKIAYGNQVCYFYYVREDSLMNSKFSMKRLDTIEALEQIRNDIPLETYGIREAYASQMLESIVDMFISKPKINEIKQLGLWKLILQYRKTVVRDSEVSKRVKGYALISYLGLPVMMWIVKTYYEIKWKLITRI